MSSNTTKSSNPWLIIPDPKPQARYRLLCLPYGGVGAAVYFPWIKLLPAEIELCPLRLPGRETRMREAPLTELFSLVEELAQALCSYLDRPFAVFGHSMGALIGFELVKTLHEQFSSDCEHLFVSARRAANLPELNPLIHGLSDVDLIKEVQRRYNGIPSVILQDDELLKVFLPTLRADITLVETYTYRGTCVDTPITAFGGLENSLVSGEDLAAWSGLTDRDFRMRIFSGDHFYFQNHLQALIQEIVSDLSS